MKIVFGPEAATYRLRERAIQFPALVNGKRIACRLDVEALADHYEVTEVLPTFRHHQNEIESIVATMLRNGWPVVDNELCIHNRDFTLFKERTSAE